MKINMLPPLAVYRGVPGYANIKATDTYRCYRKTGAIMGNFMHGATLSGDDG